MFGLVFVIGALFTGVVIIRALEIVRGTQVLPDPRSDEAFFFFIGVMALVALSYFIGKCFARVLGRSKVRFFRSYRHQ